MSQTKSKKVLILAYDFPPYVSVGALRPYSWYKYFMDFGIEPVIITRQWENKYGNQLDYISPGWSDKTIVEKTNYGTILRTPYKPNLANRIMLKHGASKYRVLRKFISAYFEIFQFIFLIGTKSGLYFTAKDYLKDNRVDAIIATGDPFILFRYASLLSKKFKIPWVADYRDPWVQDKSYKKNRIYEKWIVFCERISLKGVSKLITVSSYVQKQISVFNYIRNKSFEIIPNGFDHENLPDSKENQQSSKVFQIGFAGTIYPWHPLESFLKVCNNLIKEQIINVQIIFYGINKENCVKSLIFNKYNALINCVEFEKRVPNKALLKELSHCNMLLLFNDYYYLGTKIFDYIAVNRKIILCYRNDQESNILKEKYYRPEKLSEESDNIQEQLILKTNSGVILQNADHLREVMISYFNIFKEKKQIEGTSINTDQYTRKAQVKRIASIIREL